MANICHRHDGLWPELEGRTHVTIWNYAVGIVAEFQPRTRYDECKCMTLAQFEQLDTMQQHYLYEIAISCT